jgi:hypothetical protein
MDFHGPRERAGVFVFRTFETLFYVLLKTAENFRILLSSLSLFVFFDWYFLEAGERARLSSRSEWTFGHEGSDIT